MTDAEFLKEIRSLPCIACGVRYQVEAHHIQTRGAGGKNDSPWNILPLCAGHHTQRGDAWHRGPKTFLKKYPHVWEHMLKLGWEDNNGNLFHPEMHK